MPATATRSTKRSSSHNKRLLKSLPGYDPFREAGKVYRMNWEKAERVIEFFETCLHHVKGEKAGETFKLEKWQKAILANLFGWEHKDTGYRRYREAFILIPRKNGKTTLSAGIVLWMLFCDGEPGAEVYSAACDREQAALVFQQAKGMVLQEPELESRSWIKSATKVIERKTGDSFFKSVSSESESKHGYNAHAIIIDELHAMGEIGRPLVDALQTSFGSRRQPLLVYITTSDFSRPSICNDKYDYACKVRDGIIDAPTFLPVIYEATTEEDWTAPAVWKKANPNFGISLKEDYIEQECEKAKAVPSYENTFKRLHLNIRTEQEHRWIPLESWDDCAGGEFLDKLNGQPCYAGVDLAATKDITALALVWYAGDKVYFLPTFWIPENSAQERQKRDGIPYLDWARSGHLELTDGEVADYSHIRQRLIDMAKKYQVQEIAIDPWNATHLMNQLRDEDGLPVGEFNQGFRAMTGPSKELERLISGKIIVHDGNPVMRWMMSNVVIKQDDTGNIKPVKGKSTEKIDGVVALIMALGVGAQRPVDEKSVYEDRGFLFL